MATEQWTIDTSHSNVDFVVRHLIFSKTRGTFTDWSGSIEINQEEPAKSVVKAKIAVASIDTRDKKRDGHLLSADFFVAEQYPSIEFISRRIEGNPLSDAFKVIGDLTIKGKTQEITLEADYNGLNQDPWGNTRVHYSAKTTIKREDFDLTYNQVLEAGGFAIGEDVKIEVEIEAVKAAPPAAP